jgi:hypothetical protein
MRAERIRASALVVLLGAVLAAAPAWAKVFHYTATTEKTFAGPETVRAGVFNWQCEAHACKINGPWAEPGVGLCKTLSKVVGKITSFGYPDAELDDKQLAECNADVAASGAAGAKP